MENKSIKKNFIYNLILTSLNLIFPLVTSPYLSNILGPTNIGKVNYATSVVSWFTLFAAFGIPRYGIREIARSRDNKKDLTNVFWNLLLIQFILSIIAIIIYLIIIFNVKVFKEDLVLYILMTMTIILNIFSIDWFYQGIEEYGYVTIRNISVKLISLALIFLMIRKHDDFLLYAVINIFALGFNNILNYAHTKKYIDKKIYEIKIKFYLKELKMYFLTTLVITLYTQIDQIFVGTYSQTDLAYYMRSKMVLNVGFGVVNSIVTVLIPRTAYLIENDYEKYSEIVNDSINYIYILALPGFFGILLLSKQIMLLLGGESFLPATYSLNIISISIIINSIGGWQVNQILLPHRKETLAFNTQFFAAIISFVLNAIFVPKFSYIGAAVIWIFVETFLAIIVAIFIKISCKGINIKYINKSMLKYLIASIMMSIPILIIRNIFTSSMLIILLSLIVSPIVYFTVIILLKDKLVTDVIKGMSQKYLHR